MTKAWNPKADMPSLKGKDAVVTGGYSGLGLSTVKFLALKGARVFIAVRSEDRARAAIKTLLADEPSIEPPQLQFIRLDLEDLSSIIRATDEIKAKTSKVDMLFNNAGRVERETTPINNWEPNMAVNYIGPFAFTNHLMPLLEVAVSTTLPGENQPTIVNVSSNTTYMACGWNYSFDFTSADAAFRNYNPSVPLAWRIVGGIVMKVDMVRYAVAKEAFSVFSKDLQRRLKERKVPITCIALHPGAVASEGTKTIGTWVFNTLAPHFQISCDQGSVPGLFAATSKEVRENLSKYQGKFIDENCKLRKTCAVEEDPVQVRALWDVTTAEVNSLAKSKGLPLLRPW